MSLHEVAAEHDHARNPEEKNFVGGDQQRCRIKHCLIARLLRPSQSGEGQQAGREPGIEHVGHLLELHARTFSAGERSLASDHHMFAFAAGPRRNPMAPPQLARNAPVVDVVHPVQIDRAVVVGEDRDLAILHGFACAVGERLDLDEPLLGKTRLDDGSTAVALADGERIVLRGDQESLLLQVREHTFARHEAVEASVRTRVLVHVRVLVHHINLRQIVAQARLKVVGIVCGRHFHSARAKFRLREFVGDDRNLAIHQRQHDFLAMQMLVAFVFGVNGDRGIAQHRLGTSRGHRDELVTSDDRITNLPQMSRDIFVLHFEIRDRSLVPGTPVHDVVATINQALFVQADEHFAHGVRKIVVHGEVFAVPVDGGAEALHLVEDGAAVKLLPLPNALDKFLAAHVAALLAFFFQLLLDHHLCGDAGVIGAGQPERDEAAHAMPAHDDVHLRLVEHVAHVQAPRDIGRR